MVHIKRVVPEQTDQLSGQESELVLRMVVCSIDCMPERISLGTLLEEKVIEGRFKVVLGSQKISKHQAYTKKQAAEWTEKSGWPLLWRGNPKAVRVEFDLEETNQAFKYLAKVAEISKSQCQQGKFPTASILVDPEKNEIIGQKCDSRDVTGNPIGHSIMDLALDAAERETENRELQREKNENGQEIERTYLCLNMHVYTTHEPCIMCAMALVHSRIARLIYIKPTPASGAISPTSGAGYGVHWNKQLNWTYEAWEWVPLGPELGSTGTEVIDKHAMGVYKLIDNVVDLDKIVSA